MADEDAVTGDAHATRIALTFEVAAFPFAGGLILYGWDGRDPMDVLDVAEEVEISFKFEGAGLRVFW